MISILGPVAPKIPIEESVCTVLHNPKREKKRQYREFLIQLNLPGLTDCPFFYDTILCTVLLLKFPLFYHIIVIFMILFFVLFCY